MKQTKVLEIISALTLLAWTVFCFCYPRYIAEYNSAIDELFAPMLWAHYWLGGIYLAAVVSVLTYYLLKLRK